MLRLLTRGSRMSQLYLQYLKHRNNNDDSAVAAALASIKSMLADDDKANNSSSAISQKDRFKAYQKGFMSLGDSIDPG